jgi:hypothetical protein
VAEVKAGQGFADQFEVGDRGEVEQRLRDRGDGNGVVDVAVEGAAGVDPNAGPGALVAGSRNFDHLGWVVDEPTPVCGGCVAEHCAGTCVENSRPQVGLAARSGMPKAVDTREDLHEAAIAQPRLDGPSRQAKRQQLPEAHPAGLALGYPPSSFSAGFCTHMGLKAAKT